MSTADIQLSVVFGGQYSFEKLQSDYEQTNPLERDFIKNLPDLVNFEAETVTTETVIFEENPTGTIAPLKLQYNPTEKTLEFGLKDGGVLQLGKEMFEEYTNIDTVALTNGMIVSTAAISGNRKGIKRTDFTSLTSIRSIVGMVTVASIGTNQSGRVTTKGIINDLNTNGIGEGSQLWGNPSVLGGWSGSKPAKPQYAVQIGQVVVASATVGSVELNIAKDVKFSDLADVNGNTNLIDNADTIPKRDADGIIREISVADIKADFKADTDLIYEPLLGFMPENTANKGQANGYASLGADGLVPSTQLPSFVDDVLEFANLAAFPVTGEQGKIYVALDTNKTYRWSGSAYIYITSGAVDSVAGKTGVVTLVKADVGLGNVDNTSDVNKPISNATQTALNGKVNTTGNESIAGVKTFLSSPIVPTPSTGGQTANKTYVDTVVVTQANVEQVRSQATNKVASSKLLDDELNKLESEIYVLTDNIFIKATEKLNKLLPTNGYFSDNSTRDVTDYINVSGLKAIKTSTTGSKLVCAGIQFYPFDKSGSGITVGNFNVYSEEYTVEIPDGYYWAVVVLRRSGVTPELPYNGDELLINGIYSKFVEYDKSINAVDKLSNPINLNLFNQDTVKFNKQPPLTYQGAYPSDTLRDVSDYINVEGLTKVKIYTIGDKLVAAGVSFYQDTIGSAGINSGSYGLYTNEYEVAVPSGYKWMVLLLRREVVGAILPYNGDELVVQPIFDVIPNRLLPLRKQDAIDVSGIYAPAKLTGKRAAVFGSSNTTEKYGIWFQDLCDSIGITDYRSYGIGASTYPIGSATIPSGMSWIGDELIGEPNSMVTVIEHVLTNYSDYIPNVIMLNSGMNEASAAFPIGDVSTVFSKTLAEIRASNDNSYGINTVAGAVRWCIETLITQFPNATIICVLPWQTGNLPVNAYFKNNLLSVINNICGWLSVPVINAFEEGGFYSEFEKAAPYKYTLDNIHVKLNSTINNDGRKVQNRFIVKEFYGKYYEK